MKSNASSLVLTKKHHESDLSLEQKIFYRLQKKIETLQKKQQKLIQDLDQALQFYYGHIAPKKKEFAQLLIERTEIAYRFYKKNPKFSKREKTALKELILDDIEQLLQIIHPNEMPEELKQIFKDLNGLDYEEAASNEFEEMKCDLQDFFSELEIDVDLSKIDIKDKEEEMIQKIFQSIHLDLSEKDNPFSKQKKTKRQIEQELKHNQAQEMQKKSLNTIYKQLAKTFHPDLEPDSEKKHQKEELMKKLTAAYEENNLYALLDLELEWMNASNNTAIARGPEQIKIYNEILKDQIEALQLEINLLWDCPKYYPLHYFYPNFFEGIAVLEIADHKMQLTTKHLHQLVERLRTSNGESILRKAIQEKNMSKACIPSRNF